MYTVTIRNEKDGQIEDIQSVKTGIEAVEQVKYWCYSYYTMVADDLNTEDFRVFDLYMPQSSRPSYIAYIEKESNHYA